MDPDYRMAVLLQKQFEQESFKASPPPSYSNDLKLALSLQEQFKKEQSIEKPGNNLVYETKKSKSKKDTLNSSKCLIDPSWEVIDPTPDVHNLFVAFNQRFFWDKLLTVCVSWSKRMTSCAGICSYQGRGGLCSITLSEPLLKLRPRKDLVETLLHEMIHAYLFVTNNNKDRDGHGPEFHKHMYRINGEAGTNITVYHDFHDEVRLYQTHWWRCDGPCQKRRPYFGMVRRAQNRAPGPNDNWWKEHSLTCGGTFIKVREPEKNTKLQKENKTPKSATSSKNTTDIRNFIPTLKDNSCSTSNKTIQNNSIKSQVNNNNVHTITNNSSNNAKVSTVIPKAGNIFGFTNLSGGSCSPKVKSTETSQTKTIKDLDKNRIKGSVRNATNSTIVINKPATKTTQETKVRDTDSTPKSVNVLSNGHKLSNHTAIEDYSAVRNHWLNKFGNAATTPKGIKRSSIDGNETSPKIPKLTPCDNVGNSNVKTIIIDLDDESNFPSQSDKASCPICGNQFPLGELNDHLDICLKKNEEKDTKNESFKECFICDKKILENEFEQHVSACLDSSITIEEPDDVVPLRRCYICDEQIPDTEFDKHFSACVGSDFNSETNFSEENNEIELKECLICCRRINKDEYEKHVAECSKENLNNVIDLSINEDSPLKKNCPVCEVEIESKSYELHVEKCLLSMYDDMEKSYLTKEETTCLACEKNILKSELNAHLDICMSKVFSNNSEPVASTSKVLENTDKKYQYNCPFCMKLFSEHEMNDHVNDCLNIIDDEPEYENNKKNLIDSFSDNDFDNSYFR